MSESKKRGGWKNPAAAANGRKAQHGGRPAKGTRIEAGAPVHVSHHVEAGAVVMGQGTVRIEGSAMSRLVVVDLPDGTELRLLFLR